MRSGYPDRSFSEINNLYWFVRNLRPHESARQRALYRRIADEKKRLIESGVDAEELRLYCRMMANPRNRFAALRWRVYVSQMRLDI